MRKLIAFLVFAALAAAGLTGVPASAANDAGGGDEAASATPTELARQPWRFVRAQFPMELVGGLREQGYDVVETRISDIPNHVEVDLIANGIEILGLTKAGVAHEVISQFDAEGDSLAADANTAADGDIWRSWSEPGGLEDEMRAVAAANPDIVKLVKFGRSEQGQDLLALKVTKDPNRFRDGIKPTVVYASLQHAREWIVGEMNRRLLHHVIDGYRTDPAMADLVDNNELWFILVANPDGYDHTFTDGNRLWRKNMADNDGDGEITGIDGVDLNRNWPAKWGYDNEGSSPSPNSGVYRGPSSASEPETRALDGLVRRISPEFFVNYHSAAELLLYGNGWQVSTPEPDDHIHEALLGDDANPAVAGYDPDIGAELYITNGETNNHMSERYGILGYTPELDTCNSAETLLPDDEFDEQYCERNALSVFEFPEDETLIQIVFEKNLPLAMSLARSAADPDDPVSSLGLETPDFVIDSFDVSYGAPQQVAVEMKRSFRDRKLHFTINGGSMRATSVRLFDGGETYGDGGNSYFAEYRGTVTRGRPGDEITVWFSARDGAETLTSESFSYTIAGDNNAPVLLLVNEDYLGFGPVQGVSEPPYAGVYGAAIAGAKRRYDTWDVSVQGVPHHLGVLSHYKAVVWELGDNRLTQEEEDTVTDTPFGPIPDLAVAEAQQYLTISVRDYLNEGGKLVYTGEYTGYYGTFGPNLGGAYYGLNGDPSAPCVVTQGFFEDCLIFSDDFAQYYLGVYGRQDFGAPEQVVGSSARPTGSYDVNGAEVPNSGSFIVTSDILPASEFRQFRSESSMVYTREGPGPFDPFDGEYYMAAQHSNGAWNRLTTEIDLSAASDAELGFKLSYQVEGGYDHVVVEARTAGGDDYTTLVDLNGGTSTQVPAECAAAFFISQHPELARYLTLGGEGCTPSGTSGDWNSFSGDSGGWTDAAFDLSAYAGSVVEVSVSYITDPNTGGIGVFVDNTVVDIDGATTTTDFEANQGDWTTPGAPATSPGNFDDWTRSMAVLPPPSAAVSTDDTITFGFGLEAITTPEERASLMRQVLNQLGA